MIENVLVTHNDFKYQTTRHMFKLNLIDRTKFTKIDESVIPVNHFDFVSFKDILQSNREDKHVGKFSIRSNTCFNFIFLVVE